MACLAFARSWEDRASIIKGKHVTGHCKEYDYKDGTGFVGADINMGPPPYPLEYILRDATAPDGAYHGNYGHETSVIVDRPLHPGLVPRRGEAGRGPGIVAAPLRLVRTPRRRSES